MAWLRAIGWTVLFCSLAFASEPNRGSEAANALRQVRLDPDQTYRVRDVELARGDIKIYLTEGVLSFLTPVSGRCIGAVFTTSGTEAGDSEVLVLPPQRAERASLASFIQTPNLDEHFASALFLFSDDTQKEVLSQLQNRPIRKAPEIANDLAPTINPLVESVASEMDVKLVQALLDAHKPEHGAFYSMIVGRTIGPFDVLYTPTQFEPVSLGRLATGINGQPNFQLWSSFRPRHAPAFVPPEAKMSDCRIDAIIHPDLSMLVTADFTAVAGPEDGSVFRFDISTRLKVLGAKINGKPVEVFQHDTARSAETKSEGSFLLISDAPLVAGTRYSVEVQYAGSVIHETPGHAYFVDARNTWYPIAGPVNTTFDLTFHCPERLKLVSTGELVSEQDQSGIRTVHRRTIASEHLAGFNLGEYESSSQDHGGYHVECYSNSAESSAADPDLLRLTGELLDEYTRKWGSLPIHTVAISPIPGYFGQGFPGLIYLSDLSYLPEKDRPSQLRTSRLDFFFSDLLLPHEVAHQWWGNMVSPANYRTNWLLEAMANDSALQTLKQRKGTTELDDILAQYRNDLVRERDGKRIDSAGPVDFGERLIATADTATWHVIVYEKGSWILQMLRRRLGDDGFQKMQIEMLREFRAKPITNDDFRRIAARYLPVGQKDKDLALFFDTWVYGTGIPRLTLERSGQTLDLEVSGVDPDFTVDVPLSCKSIAGKQETRWVRASTGSNVMEAHHGEPVACALPSASDFLYTR